MTSAPTPATIGSAAELLVARCRQLAMISDVAGETTRLFLSSGMRRANDCVATWMRDAGLAVRMDAAGNLRGRMGGEGSPLVVASHLDTVLNAGAFDGVLGVLAGVALATLCGPALPFPLEVIAFSEEEGVRFGAPFIGSRGMVGSLDEALLHRVDQDGVSVTQAIEAYGLDVSRIPDAHLVDARAYVEFHLEQGPVLENEGLPVGVVSAIAGQSRYVVTFAGHANHAGTTPMHIRQDAVCAAAAWIGEVEQYAKQHDGLLATVGSVEVSPGASNVIAGCAVCTLDVRCADNELREQATRYLLHVATACGAPRGVAVRSELCAEQSAVAMHAKLTQTLSMAVADVGLPVKRVVSGAGHDAMIVAPHMPTAMLFLRTPGGLSHHPDESVRTDDVAVALAVGVSLLRRLGEGL